MLGQTFDLLGYPVRRGRLEGLHNLRVQDTPLFLQEAAVGHLVGQGMLEGVFTLGEQTRLVQKLSCLELRQATMQHLLRHPGDSVEQGKGDLHTAHCSDLEQVFDIRGETINTGREHGLYGGGDLNARQGLHQTVLSRGAD